MTIELEKGIKVASAGNRTRAARVAGEHSTTEPPMLLDVSSHARLSLRPKPSVPSVLMGFGDQRAMESGMTFI